MIKSFLAGIAIMALGSGGSALAADVMVERFGPIVPPPVAYNWTGFYLGGTVGGHFGHAEVSADAGVTAIDSVSATSLRPQGALAGLQAGYNWQIGQVVVGIELDGNWLDGTASRTLTNFRAPFNPADVMTNTASSVFLATLRPRLGVVFDRLLLYVTGGLAFSTIKTSDTFTSLGGTALAVNNNSTCTGETIGGGFEYAFLDSWTFKAEYLYVSFGSFDTTVGTTPIALGATPITVHHKYSDNIARVGLNYRFFGPVYWKE